MGVLETNNFLIDFTFAQEPFILDNIRLYQVGKKFCSPETVVGEHFHDGGWFELTVILDGNGEISANGKSVQVQQGDLFLSYPNEFHDIITDANSPIKYSFLSFCLEKNLYKKEFEEIINSFPEAEHRVFNEPNITFLIDQIIGELLTSNYEKETVISLSLQQILLLLIRSFLYTQAKPAPDYANKNELLCHKIMQYINRNVFSLRNLTELADHLNYNYSYLAKIFKQTTNTTILQYFTERKLQCAKALIKEGALSFTEISELLNFASIYSFSKSFKFHFGLSPIEYKRTCRNADNPTKKSRGAQKKPPKKFHYDF